MENAYASPTIPATRSTVADSAFRLSRAAMIAVAIVALFFSGYGVGYWRRMTEETTNGWRETERIRNGSIHPDAMDGINYLRDASIQREQE